MARQVPHQGGEEWEKVLSTNSSVTPAKAGIQESSFDFINKFTFLDPRFRGDGNKEKV